MTRFTYAILLSACILMSDVVIFADARRTASKNDVIDLAQATFGEAEEHNDQQAISTTLSARRRTASMIDLAQATFGEAEEYNDQQAEEEVFAALSSKVGSLETRLAEVQNEGTANIKADKDQYEAQLGALHNQNLALEKMNADLTKRVHDVQYSNMQLRSKADTLTKSGASLTADLQSLRANLSAAQEFADAALTDSDDLLTNAEHLKVLEELAQQDAAAWEAQAHENRLNEIRKSRKVSMLQTTASSLDNGNALDILQSLASALDDLAQEQNTSRESLKEHVIMHHATAAETGKADEKKPDKEDCMQECRDTYMPNDVVMYQSCISGCR